MRKAGPAILLILAIALCFWISGAAADTSGSCGTNVTWSLNTLISCSRKPDIPVLPPVIPITVRCSPNIRNWS